MLAMIQENTYPTRGSGGEAAEEDDDDDDGDDSVSDSVFQVQWGSYSRLLGNHQDNPPNAEPADSPSAEP